MGETHHLQATLLVALGGALGSVARYWITLWSRPVSHRLPWGTIGINITGSFLIGVFAALPAPDSLRLFLMVGLCGGFTTFSSFSLQTFDLARTGAPARAALNVAASVLLCLAAVWLGHALVESWGPKA